jgi:ferric iron reductase protein FhuF
MDLPSLQQQNKWITAEDLTDKAVAASYMQQLGEKIDSPSLMITASQFTKSYGRSIACPVLTAHSLDDAVQDVSIGNTQIHTDWTLDKWKPHIEFASSVQRTPGLEKVIAGIFAEHLTPVWHALHLVTKAPLPILWENTAVRIFSLYEKKLVKDAGASLQQKLIADLHYIFCEAPGELFGEKTNPLQPFYRTLSDSRIRQTCCFHYKTGGGKSYCGTCPKKRN